MRTSTPLILLATAVVTGCSTVGSRKAEQTDAYNALSARHRALVDEGFIDVGMNTNAVYIAWGKPYEIMRVDFPSGERTVWVYTGAVSEPVSSWQYRPSSNPYGARRKPTNLPQVYTGERTRECHLKTARSSLLIRTRRRVPIGGPGFIADHPINLPASFSPLLPCCAGRVS